MKDRRGAGAGSRSASPRTQPEIAPPRIPNARAVAEFRGKILGFYADSGRSFPWRSTKNTWAILVSEFMLQQTQTQRVVPKYAAWMKEFPKPEHLARAPLSQALALWSGLGYNRRALALTKTASLLAAADRFPDTEEELITLPGVGVYTARAVLAFAFDKPVVLIETNIRAVFLDEFFKGIDGVSDSRLTPIIEATMLREDPRTWYYALMDYGVEIKKRGNPNQRSAHYSRQSAFADSNRRIRGALLKSIGEGEKGLDELAAALPFARERVRKALSELVEEGFVAESEDAYTIAD